MTAGKNSRSLSIGPISLPNNAILAPMSGVTDVAFRRIAVRYGAGAVVTEMIASAELAEKNPEFQLRAEGEGIYPHIVQLAGREPQWMAEGARAAN